MTISKDFCFVVPNSELEDVKQQVQGSWGHTMEIYGYTYEKANSPGLGNHIYVTVSVNPLTTMREFIKYLAKHIREVENILLVKESTTHELNWDAIRGEF